MTADSFSEFLRQNGAFGVLMVLILAAAWWGLPWLVTEFRRVVNEHRIEMQETTAKHKEQVKQLTDRFADSVDRNTLAIERQEQAIAANTLATERLNDRVETLHSVITAIRTHAPTHTPSDK